MTTVRIGGFAPTTNVIGLDEVPLATGIPSTVIVELALFAVGVMVTLLTPLLTLSVYKVVLAENAGVSVPELIARLLKLASAETVGSVVKLTTAPGDQVPATSVQAA